MIIYNDVNCKSGLVSTQKRDISTQSNIHIKFCLSNFFIHFYYVLSNIFKPQNYTFFDLQQNIEMIALIQMQFFFYAKVVSRIL